MVHISSHTDLAKYEAVVTVTARRRKKYFGTRVATYFGRRRLVEWCREMETSQLKNGERTDNLVGNKSWGISLAVCTEMSCIYYEFMSPGVASAPFSSGNMKGSNSRSDSSGQLRWFAHMYGFLNPVSESTVYKGAGCKIPLTIFSAQGA